MRYLLRSSRQRPSKLLWRVDLVESEQEGFESEVDHRAGSFRVRSRAVGLD
jgi:hypothetical protein